MRPNTFLGPRLQAEHRRLVARTPEQVADEQRMTRALIAARWLNMGFGWWRETPTGPSLGLAEAYRRMGEQRSGEAQ